MTCQDVDELLGAYALDALDADEAQLVRAHLATCDRHADAMAFRGVASRLGALAAPVAPVSALRARVLGAVASTTQDSPEAPARRPRLRRVQQGVLREPPNVITFTRRNALAALSVAAAIVIAVGVAGWAIGSRGRSSEDLQQLASRATWVTTMHPASGSGSASVIYFADEKKALVAATGLDPLDSSRQTYQLWAIAGGVPRSLGVMNTDSNGNAAIVVALDASDVDVLAATVEPAGGSAQPTSDPIMSARI